MYHFFFQIPHINDITWYLSFSFWFALLSRIISGQSVLLQSLYFIFFNDWVIFHRVYVPHLLCWSICWWTFRLLPCLGYCKQFCNEHWGACILSQHVFIQIYAWSRIVGSYSSSSFSFLRSSILFAIAVVSVYIPVNSARGSVSPTLSPAFIVCRFFADGHSHWCEVLHHGSFDLYFSND